MSILDAIRDASYQGRTAEEWYVRLHADDVTAEERRAFAAWLDADPANRREYGRCATVWETAQGLSDHSRAEEALERLGDKTETPARDGTLLRHFGPATIAASVLVIAFAALLLLVLTRAPRSFETERGEYETVVLADGSSIVLNTDTRIEVRLSEETREVELLRGEAFFDIASLPGRPFLVRTDDAVVRVVGTQFGLRRDPGNLSVVVVEGLVEVLSSPVDTEPEARREASATLRVASGERLSLAIDRASPPDKEVIDPERALAWRNGRIYFADEPLSAVVAEVNRYLERPFVITDPELSDLRLSGVFKTGDAEAVAFALRESFGIAVERKEDARILSRRPKPASGRL